MNKKDQDAIAKLYSEGFSSETYRNTGSDDDRYNDEDFQPATNTSNISNEWHSGDKKYVVSKIGNLISGLEAEYGVYDESHQARLFINKLKQLIQELNIQ